MKGLAWWHAGLILYLLDLYPIWMSIYVLGAPDPCLWPGKSAEDGSSPWDTKHTYPKKLLAPSFRHCIYLTIFHFLCLFLSASLLFKQVKSTYLIIKKINIYFELRIETTMQW